MSSELSSAPRLDEILARLGPVRQEKVFVQDRTFLIKRPVEADKLLDLPAVHAAFDRDEYMPYWADLWPAARMLAKFLPQQTWPAGLQALEVGCGLGLAGIVALSLGMRVTFTDYDPCALKFAADNARLNGFTDFTTREIDWRHPPEDFRFPLVLGSDLIYETRLVDPLVSFLKSAIAPEGTAIIVDQDRIPATLFRETLDAKGLQFATQTVKAGEPGGRRLKGTLYRITHRA
jgi:predicted nicotinamide N-methyase